MTHSNKKKPKSDDLEPKSDFLDKGSYRWLIVFGSFIIYFLADGISLSFGIFTREFIDYFKRSDSQSFVFLTSGLIQSVPLFLSPIVCVIINKYECRSVAFVGSIILFVSFILTRFCVDSLFSLNLVIGLMASSGLACVYIPAYLIISFHFEKLRALATGIAVSGSGLGLFFLSPLSEYLIQEFGWKDTCFIFAAIASHTFISACLFRQPEAISKIEIESKNETNAKSLFSDLKTIYGNKNFLLLSLSYFILSFSIVCPHNFLPSHIKFKNIDDPNSISISLIGISALIGQITIGYISDKYRHLNWLIFAVCISLAGFITCLLPLTSNLNIICVYSVLYGFLTSVNYVLQSSLVIESLGLANLTIAFGCLQLCQGFSTLFGTPFLGWVKDYSKDYELTFYISGLLMILSGASLLLWPCFIKKNHDLIQDNQIEAQEFN